MFAGRADIGGSRERVYAEFLRQHAPSKCNVFLGGFLFDLAGAESKQLDVIVTTDTAPRFNLHNRDGSGKAFSPVAGTLAVASIKTYLDHLRLCDALDGLASIPPTKGQVRPILPLTEYGDWPYKIIYATGGSNAETVLGHLEGYYERKGDIPVTRRPNIIHVAGQYAILRVLSGMTLTDQITGAERQPDVGTFHLTTVDPDLQGMIWVVDALQRLASASAHMVFNYGELINRVIN